MILVIDNYDSFTYNLVQYMGTLQNDIIVRRNDEITCTEIEQLLPERIVISPGPGYPQEAGVSLKIIQYFFRKVPILGVCLGHQCIVEAMGGTIGPAPELVHGKPSDIYHDGKNLFKGVQNPFPAGRYHSLIAERDTLPDCLEITASTKDDLVMGVRHKKYPLEGLQFHPESILTREGMNIIKNFMNV
ncbi:aminodeoxychorismate/anthranilate synthase component II [candidate division KSB1 bacterium]|nr:aminodeoxychorismate/anthranilate synthase component II [candidate division KSB1 bacterium]